MNVHRKLGNSRSPKRPVELGVSCILGTTVNIGKNMGYKSRYLSANTINIAMNCDKQV